MAAAAADGAESPFAGRVAALGTMHGKEAVIRPALAAGLGLGVVVPAGIDTDRFGTFTREVARPGTQRDAARAKAEAALALADADIGVASEGSFGPHPAAPWVQADLELVVLVDRRLGVEIVGRHLTTEVVAAGGWVASVDEALAFAAEARFPSHALVVRADPDEPVGIVKGIADEGALRRAVAPLLAERGRAWLENDLRAHHNPTRMAAIAAAAADLVANARRRCPTCGAPGLSPREPVCGLPCAWCGTPTGLVVALVDGCDRCGARRERPRDDGRRKADPGECPRCNP